MAEQNLDAVKQLARDLRTQEPRAPKETLGGYEYGARALDKCRASLVGLQGDFKFNCPMDQRFFAASGIDAETFKAQAASGASDEDMERWVQENATSASA
jgi:hypothetical protein